MNTNMITRSGKEINLISVEEGQSRKEIDSEPTTECSTMLEAPTIAKMSLHNSDRRRREDTPEPEYDISSIPGAPVIPMMSPPPMTTLLSGFEFSPLTSPDPMDTDPVLLPRVPSSAAISGFSDEQLADLLLHDADKENECIESKAESTSILPFGGENDNVEPDAPWSPDAGSPRSNKSKANCDCLYPDVVPEALERTQMRIENYRLTIGVYSPWFS